MRLAAPPLISEETYTKLLAMAFGHRAALEAVENKIRIETGFAPPRSKGGAILSEAKVPSVGYELAVLDAQTDPATALQESLRLDAIHLVPVSGTSGGVLEIAHKALADDRGEHGVAASEEQGAQKSASVGLTKDAIAQIREALRGAMIVDSEPAIRETRALAFRVVQRTLAVTFARGVAALRAGQVDTIVRWLRPYADSARFSISIVGLTDSTGSYTYNQALARRRADAVEDAILSNLSIAPIRVSKGSGAVSSRLGAQKADAASNRAVLLTLHAAPAVRGGAMTSPE
jgi:outer membrane protein OmpA-like peptidoglycan-associated protein